MLQALSGGNYESIYDWFNQRNEVNKMVLVKPG